MNYFCILLLEIEFLIKFKNISPHREAKCQAVLIAIGVCVCVCVVFIFQSVVIFTSCLFCEKKDYGVSEF